MFCGGRLIWKNVELVPKVFTPVRHCSAVKQHDLGVDIPKRIERGNTDILRALASTVQHDPTAFPYKYPDDPFFYTYSALERRKLALSLESGKKSARWIVENNPGFFKNQLSDPPIEAFLQKKVYNENTEVTEETLIEVIEKRNVANAITVYNLLQQKGTIVSDNVKQDLLELVCFYNSQDRPNEEELEAKWFSNVDHNKLEVNTWQEQGFAETLFKSMDPNCPLANSAMIQGMIRYNNVQQALEIYNRGKANNLEFPVGVYNALLSQASNTSIDVADGLGFIDGLLKEMSAKSIKPNIGTLNAALRSLMYLQHIHKNNGYVKNLVMEFAYLGIPPSLGTYHYLFRILGFPKKPSNIDLLLRLLDVIQGTKHRVMHPSDFAFFPSSMNFFSSVLKSMVLVHRLHDILFQGDNFKFIENSFSESLYFREYFSILFKYELLDIAMEKYDEVVPGIYSPEIFILMTKLSAIISNYSVEHFVKFWEEIKRLKMTRSLKLLSKILAAVDVFTEEAALKVCYEAAISMKANLDECKESAESGSASLLLRIFLKMKDIKRALEIFDGVKQLRHDNIELGALKELFLFALDQKNVPLMLDCLKHVENEVFAEVREMAEMALPFISESDKTWVTRLITNREESQESCDPADEMDWDKN